MKDSIGYDELHPIRNRVCRVAGRSSARIVPWPAGDSFRSSSAKKTNSPLKVSAMKRRPRGWATWAVRLNSSVPAQLGLKFKPKPSSSFQASSFKLSNQPVQSPSDKRPNQSNKLQASSLKLQALLSLNHGTWILEKF